MGWKSRIPKCPHCHYESFGHNIRGYALKRLYIKNNGKWRTVGWICPRCGYTTISIPPGALGSIPTQEIKYTHDPKKNK